MVIGIDGSRAFIEGKTGTENYSFQLLKALAKIDTENRYLIYIRPNSKFQIPNSKKWPDNFKFKVISAPRLWTQVGLALRTLKDPLDVLFVPSHTLPLLRKPGLKTVITVHDLGAEYLPLTHQLKQIAYLKLMTHYQLKTATKIIAVSQATKADLMKRVGIVSEKISVVYEGVDKNIFKQMSKDIVNDIVKKYDIDRGKYFLFVGTIQPRKNLERLITAFSMFLNMEYGIWNMDKKNKSSKFQILNSKYKLVLVGQKGWKSESIYQLPKKLGVEDEVKFLGRIPDQDLVALYNGAVALAYPSLFEGFGLPIIEAFACGCPVITSDTSSMPEVAGEAALLVNPVKEEEVARAMSKLSADDKLRNSLIQKGYNRAKEFDWEKAAKETVETLKEAIKE